ncbi:hypothetical protein BGW80DRAFT_301296 [Lactifluus volemus]|nr:hypothetical protein BGW80DRAFT_301296 [Lactifluus volemus]
MTSSSVDGLPNQTAVSNSHHTKPRSICRNFVYRGVCGDKACPRAHVPYNDMVDLLAYLTERDDFPPELRFVTKRLTRPDLSRCRQQYSSDRICSYFLHGSCRLNERCPRAHLRSFQIYRSLLRTANVKVRYFCSKKLPFPYVIHPARPSKGNRHPTVPRDAS